MKNISIIILFLNLHLFGGGGVDIVVDSYSSYNKAQKGMKKLESFIKEHNLTAKAKMNQIGDFFYLKVGEFNNSIRNDEKFLALFSLKYPNMVIVSDQVIPKPINKASQFRPKENNNPSFWKKNQSLIQWILMLIMSVWAGVILYLRFKTIKTLKSEQNEISKEQDSIELTLNKNREDKNNEN